MPPNIGNPPLIDFSPLARARMRQQRAIRLSEELRRRFGPVRRGYHPAFLMHSEPMYRSVNPRELSSKVYPQVVRQEPRESLSRVQESVAQLLASRQSPSYGGQTGFEGGRGVLARMMSSGQQAQTGPSQGGTGVPAGGQGAQTGPSQGGTGVPAGGQGAQTGPSQGGTGLAGGLTLNQYQELEKEYLDLIQSLPEEVVAQQWEEVERNKIFVGSGEDRREVTKDPFTGEEFEKTYTRRVVPAFSQNPLAALSWARRQAKRHPTRPDWRKAFVDLNTYEQQRMDPLQLAYEQWGKTHDTLYSTDENQQAFQKWFQDNAMQFRQRARANARALLGTTDFDLAEIDRKLYVQGASELIPGSGIRFGTTKWFGGPPNREQGELTPSETYQVIARQVPDGKMFVDAISTLHEYEGQPKRSDEFLQKFYKEFEKQKEQEKRLEKLLGTKTVDRVQVPGLRRPQWVGPMFKGPGLRTWQPDPYENARQTRSQDQPPDTASANLRDRPFWAPPPAAPPDWLSEDMWAPPPAAPPDWLSEDTASATRDWSQPAPRRGPQWFAPMSIRPGLGPEVPARPGWLHYFQQEREPRRPQWLEKLVGQLEDPQGVGPWFEAPARPGAWQPDPYQTAPEIRSQDYARQLLQALLYGQGIYPIGTK